MIWAIVSRLMLIFIRWRALVMQAAKNLLRRSLSRSPRIDSFCLANSSAVVSLRSSTVTIAAPVSVTIASLTEPAGRPNDAAPIAGRAERGVFDRRAGAGVADRVAARDHVGRLRLEAGRLHCLLEVARFQRRR